MTGLNGITLDPATLLAVAPSPAERAAQQAAPALPGEDRAGEGTGRSAGAEDSHPVRPQNQSYLKFAVDKSEGGATARIVVSVIDAQSGQVIRVIPSPEFMSRTSMGLTGMLVDIVQ